MRFHELDQPQVGDILEIEIGDTVVEAVIAEITGDEIISETDNVDGGNLLLETMDKETYLSQRKELQNIQMDPETSKDPELRKELMRRKAELEKLARDSGLTEQASKEIDEAEYQGRTVKLSKPMQGDVKKFKVYVRNPATGKIIKVNFGDPNMRIKKSNPKRRKSFRARHNCANPGPRTKARYWSCRKW